MTVNRTGWALPLAAMLLSGVAVPAIASDHCPSGPAILVVAIDGAVTVTRPGGASGSLALGDRVCPGDVVAAGEDGRVELRFEADETTIGLARNSTVRIPEVEAESDVELSDGVLRFISSVRDFFSVETRHANAGIDGTEAVVFADAAAGTLVLVAEGDVTMRATAGGEALALMAGAAGFAAPGAPARPASAADVPAVFRPILLAPEGASDWAIHYPPILIAGAGDEGLEAAARALEAGDPDRAEQLLDGRTDARALALGAVVAVLRNRPEEGAALASRAIEADPQLGVSHVAASYALQASGDVDAALRAATTAAELAPEDPFALARLAELQFVAGDSVTAGRTADRSIRRGPTSLAHAVRGFSHLQGNDYEAAAEDFAAGTAIDSEDPLPRIGEGLLAIRQGNVEDGRRALELAASLDPRRGSTRTLLGRAYRQEGDPERALSQFGLASERDPDDPQPWLSAAEVLFAGNRPIEALGSIREAEERAGGRAVLRTARGLGEDQAIHAAALGRVYDTLGFTTQAIQTGAAAVEQDPTSAAGNRLLADALRSRPNADIARASSAFSAFVYDGPSKAPIQPSLTETNLALFEGPATTRPSFAELTPFYDEDGFRADLLGFGGTQETFGNEASFTALHRGFSIGVGQFHYQTDGYRFNNEVNHDIVNLQAKMQVLPVLDIFGEYRYRSTDAGDRILEFDLANGDPSVDLSEERNLLRFGGHVRAGPDHDLAGVFTWVTTNDGSQTGAGGTTSLTRGETDTLDGQLQYVGRFGDVTAIAGAAFTDFDGDSDIFFDLGGGPFRIGSIETDARHVNAYAYATWRTEDLGFLSSVELTGGVSLDSVDVEGRTSFGGVQADDDVYVNPKLGARVEVIDGFVLRGAFGRSVTPVQTVAERLEPMTLAGFTQFIDQNNFAAVWQGGIGFDAEVTDWLSVGGEAIRRRIEQPALSTTFEPEITETEFNAYVNATFGERFAGSLDFVRIDAEGGPGSLELTNYEVTEVTAGLGWFHPSGFFARGRAGVAWHEFSGANGADDDTFPVTEISLGYRLPNERGIVSLDILNVVDSDFGFEDRQIEAGTSPVAQPRYPREFTALLRARLKF